MAKLKSITIIILLSVVAFASALLLMVPLSLMQAPYTAPIWHAMMHCRISSYHGGSPISHERAVEIAEAYLRSLNDPDLVIGEFEEYSNNFYLSIVEKSSGRGAIEVIINRYSGSIHPEPQTMMWNAKYGMMARINGELRITEAQAIEIAKEFLKATHPNTEISEVVTYYGYYTLMTTLNGEHYGMLSVNGYSGAVWYHTWHGTFISKVELP